MTRYHVAAILTSSGNVVDAHGRFSTLREARAAATEAQAESDAWTVELQANFDTAMAERLRASVLDLDDMDDSVPDTRRRRAPRYEHRAEVCKCSRFIHS